MADTLDAAKAVWPARIMVTGAGGFVGRRLVPAIRMRAPDTLVLPVRGPWAQGDGDGSAAVDLTDASAVDWLVRDFEPDVVVHLSAFSSVGKGAGRTDEVWSANFDSTRAVGLAARALGSKRGRKARLIFASTAEVYGLGFKDGPRVEHAPLAPASAYSRSKAACEYLLRDMAGEYLQVIALRLFNHTGPGQADTFVVPALAAQLARLGRGTEGIVRVGNLDARRDFTDVEDIIDAYLAVLSRDTMSSDMTVYNVGSGQLQRIGTILDALIAHHGAKVDVIQDPVLMRPLDVGETHGVFSAFKNSFGWEPKRDFWRTVADIYDYEASLNSPS